MTDTGTLEFLVGQTAMFELPNPEEVPRETFRIGPANRRFGVLVPRRRLFRWMGARLVTVGPDRVIVVKSDGVRWACRTEVRRA